MHWTIPNLDICLWPMVLPIFKMELVNCIELSRLAPLQLEMLRSTISTLKLSHILRMRYQGEGNGIKKLSAPKIHDRETRKRVKWFYNPQKYKAYKTKDDLYKLKIKSFFIAFWTSLQYSFLINIDIKKIVKLHKNGAKTWINKAKTFKLPKNKSRNLD